MAPGDGESNSAACNAQNVQVIRSAVLGNIEQFTIGDCFVSYLDRLEQFFVINEIVNDKLKVSNFIAFVGTEVYKVLKSLASPVIPSTLEYSQIKEMLVAHFEPKVNSRAERFKFSTARQHEAEPMKEYIIRLRTLASTCNFGDFLSNTIPEVGKWREAAFQDALLDRFIVGIQNSKLQQSLINQLNVNPKFTFVQCCDIGVNYELSMKEQQSFSTVGNPHNINFVKKGNNNHKSKFNRQYSYKQNVKSGCNRCGRESHSLKGCPATNWKCYICNKTGHTSRVCPRKSNQVNGISENNSQINNVQSYTENVKINGQPIEMEVDTGAAQSVMSVFEFKSKLPKIKLEAANKSFRTITGQILCLEGMSTVNVTIVCKQCRQFQIASSVSQCTCRPKVKLSIAIVKTECHFRALMGRDWLDVLWPEWKEFFNLKLSSSRLMNFVSIENTNKKSNNNCELNEITNESELLSYIKQKFPFTVSSDNNQHIVGYKAELLIENCTPIFHKAYNVPMGIRSRVEAELDRLVKENVLEPVKYADWASPIVIVPKPNGEIRICIDCSMTINKRLITQHHPLPNVEEIFASLSNCSLFCVIDLKGAYQQLLVGEKSKHLLTINTHKGLFVYQRMPFGVADAPQQFQSVMDRILVNLSNVFCFYDDIIIGGANMSELKSKLCQVLSRLKTHKVKINIDKCKFLKKSVEYLGHILEYNTVKSNPKKVKAVMDAPAPKNVQELQSYLGLINYYRRFCNNLATVAKPLYSLLAKDVEFIWSSECQKSFDKTKQLLTSSNSLELYDPKKQIIVASDASPYGLGAVLSHLINGEERPVMFVSCTLSPAEQNYAQIHREALGIMFALKQFCRYIYGLHFTLYTDNQALKEIYNPSKCTSAVAASRMQRYGVVLKMYNYTVKHRPGTQMGNCDALSRLPLPVASNLEVVDSINFIKFDSQEIPIDFEQVKSATKNDSCLSSLHRFLVSGWPKQFCEKFKVFKSNEKNLSTENGCVFYGNRLVIPENLRSKILFIIHENHVGMTRMKMIARSYFWWPGIDLDIEKYVNLCEACQAFRSHNHPVVDTKWPESIKPFERVHLDFFNCNGKEFLLIVDAFSRYLDVKIMSRKRASDVITKLFQSFVIFGLPKTIVTDNGPPFRSYEFNEFCKRHAIKLLHSPIYFPQANGLAERNVQTVKSSLKKSLYDKSVKLSIEQKIQKFLIKHRNTPSTVTSKSPNEIIFNFKQRSMVDIIVDSSPMSKTSENQVELVNSHESISNNFYANEIIMYKNPYKSYVKWIKAKYLKKVSSTIHLINVKGVGKKVDVSQIRKRDTEEKYRSLQTTSFAPSQDETTNVAVSQAETAACEVAAKESTANVRIPPRRSKRIRSIYTAKRPNYKE